MKAPIDKTSASKDAWPEGRFELLTADDWTDYELLDSGDSRKLERFGEIVLDRPDAQAFWPPRHPVDSWQSDAKFAGGDDDDRGNWKSLRKDLPEEWPVRWNGLQMNARCAAFRHVGLFPEHSVHWSWAAQQIQRSNQPVRVLNLFGYTGAMSLACAQAGAEVVHLDASPKSIGFGRDNQTYSNLDDRNIRWICDDALKFLRREERRGRTYHGIILDPPKFGRGPKKEVWQLNEGLDELLGLVRKLLDPDALFVILTIYAVRLSYLAVGQALAARLAGLGGHIEWGEMTLPESQRPLKLPTAVYARWSSQ